MKPTVLIVDDAAFMRMMLKEMLKKNGFEVIGEADSGETGIAKYMELKPNITTMDITMPGMGGIEAVKIIHSKDPNALIIMCSAMGQQSLVTDAIYAGAKDFVVKPFNADRVTEAINKLLKLKVKK